MSAFMSRVVRDSLQISEKLALISGKILCLMLAMLCKVFSFTNTFMNSSLKINLECFLVNYFVKFYLSDFAYALSNSYIFHHLKLNDLDFFSLRMVRLHHSWKSVQDRVVNVVHGFFKLRDLHETVDTIKCENLVSFLTRRVVA